MSAVPMVRTPEERFAELPGFPFAPHYAMLPDGLRMHYVDEGPAGAETALLLHGQPTWSYLYRRGVVARLEARGLHVVAPDLVGFGRSDKPLARTAHTVRAHIDWMAQFVDTLGLTRITLVVQDWGGPIGLGVLAARPGLVSRVVAANTALHTADAGLAGRLTWAVHAGADGTVTRGTDPARLPAAHPAAHALPAQPLRPGCHRVGGPRPGVLAAYDAPFPDEAFSAGPRQLPLLIGLPRPVNVPASTGARSRSWPASRARSSPPSPTVTRHTRLGRGAT